MPTALPPPSPPQQTTSADPQSFIYDTNFLAAELSPSLDPSHPEDNPNDCQHPSDSSSLHHAPVALLVDHGLCGSVTDTPPGTLGDEPQVKQDFDAMDHHASYPNLSTLESPPIASCSGTPEALVIKPDPLEVAPSPCSDATLWESHPESELFWCPWLYSELTIPEHPSQTPADTCALPPYPLCPGPLLDANTPPVTRPPLSQDFAQAFPSLALIYSAVTDLGTPNYRGAWFPVPHKLNISAWKRTHRLSKCWNLVSRLGTQIHSHRPRTLGITPPPHSTHQMSPPTSRRSSSTQPSSALFSPTLSSGPDPTP